MVMFDVTNRASFKSLDYWVEQIRTHSTKENLPILIVGNKCKHHRRAILDLEIDEWLEKVNLPYIEVDNVDKHQIDESFQLIADIIYRNWKRENEDMMLPEWGITNVSMEQTVRVKREGYSCCSIS